MTADHRRLPDPAHRADNLAWVPPPPPPPAPGGAADATPASGTPAVAPGGAAPAGAPRAAVPSGGPPPDARAWAAGVAAGIRSSSTAVKTALAACALALIGLIVAISVIPGPHRTASRVAGPATTAAPSPTTATTAPATTAAAPTATTPPTTAAPTGPGPSIASLTPAAGAPGQKVAISGRNLYSASGTVTVMFGSVQAGVSCQTGTSCVATVPPQPGGAPGSSVPVTFGTAAGTSKPVAFTYR